MELTSVLLLGTIVTASSAIGVLSFFIIKGLDERIKALEDELFAIKAEKEFAKLGLNAQKKPQTRRKNGRTAAKK